MNQGNGDQSKLREIARAAMIERGLAPDFPPAAVDYFRGTGRSTKEIEAFEAEIPMFLLESPYERRQIH